MKEWCGAIKLRPYFQKCSLILFKLSRIMLSVERQYKFNSKIITCDGFTIDVFYVVIDFELLKNILEKAVQFAKDYIDSEEKEHCRMIDEYGREFEKE